MSASALDLVGQSALSCGSENVSILWHDRRFVLTSAGPLPRDAGFTREDLRERATGIEPAFSAWEADVLPLNYARERLSHYPLTPLVKSQVALALRLLRRPLMPLGEEYSCRSGSFWALA